MTTLYLWWGVVLVSAERSDLASYLPPARCVFEAHPHAAATNSLNAGIRRLRVEDGAEEHHTRSLRLCRGDDAIVEGTDATEYDQAAVHGSSRIPGRAAGGATIYFGRLRIYFCSGVDRKFGDRTGGVCFGALGESPTITYLPLSGEKFTKSLLQPVSPVDLFSLAESGWPIDAVFEVGVRAINGLHAGSRTQMLKRTGDPDFYRVLAMLRELQASDSFGIRVEAAAGGGGGLMVFRARPADEAAAATVLQVRELLHLDKHTQEFKLAFGAVAEDDKEIAMLTRSMLEILAEASAGVEIPAADVNEGRVVKMTTTGASAEAEPKFLSTYIFHVQTACERGVHGSALP